MQFAFLKRLEHRGAEAVLRAGATRCSCLSWNEIAPLVSNFMEPGGSKNWKRWAAKGMIILRAFRPLPCSHSTIRLVLALTAVPGWYSLDLDAVCAFILNDFAPGERVYMKGPAGYNIGEGTRSSSI